MFGPIQNPFDQWFGGGGMNQIDPEKLQELEALLGNNGMLAAMGDTGMDLGLGTGQGGNGGSPFFQSPEDAFRRQMAEPPLYHQTQEEEGPDWLGLGMEMALPMMMFMGGPPIAKLAYKKAIKPLAKGAKKKVGPHVSAAVAQAKPRFDAAKARVRPSAEDWVR